MPHINKVRIKDVQRELVKAMLSMNYQRKTGFFLVYGLMLFASVSISTVAAAQADPAKAASMTSGGLDRYGGWRAVKSDATGFFRVAELDGRWCFITPDGHAFISAGINHVDYREDYSDEFVDFVTGHLRDWGFNAIGWSQEISSRDPTTGVMVHSRGWGPDQYARANMPYMHLIRFTDIEWYVDEQFPDVFSDAFAQKCDRLAKDVCAKLRDDPCLIGYFYADTPNWPLWAETVGWEKLGKIARRYYQVIHDAIRRYDTNHLLLGDRYKGDRVFSVGTFSVDGLPEVVLEAMKSTVDVLSVEYYRPDPRIEEDLARWHAVTGKPILMADSAFLAPTDALKVSPNSPCYVPDQAARGKAYQKHARRLYANPPVIGWHWCAFGRSKGRKSGLLDGEDRPYEDCVRRMRDFNRSELYPVALSSADTKRGENGPPEESREETESPDDARDAIGGTTAVRAKATGYFRTEKINDRWWFVTPEGNGFLSVGINHLDLAALKHPDNVHIFRERYGGQDDRFIKEGIAAPLRDWGFNTIGWTQELVGGVWMKPNSILRHSHEWTQRQFHVAGLPYVYNLKFADIEGFNTYVNYPDVFDSEFEEWADYVARSVCFDMAEDRLLLGYADVPVPAIMADKPGGWAEGLDLDNADDLAKLQRIVRQYFRVTTDAIRRYDRNHLIFGPRFGRSDEMPDWLLKLAGEYFDVLLMNRFLTPEQVRTDLARWNDLTGKPVLISDMLYLAPTKLLRVRNKAACYVPDQKARGEAYRRFAEAAFAEPYVVGLHWCAFIENRARKSGLKNYLDEPYEECVSRMREFNRNRLYSTALRR